MQIKQFMQTKQLRHAQAGAARWLDRHRPVDKGKHLLWAIIRYMLVFGICFIILFPLISKLSVVFRDRFDFFDPTVVWIPRHFTMDNINIALELLDYGKSFTNSVLLTLGTALLQTVSCALAGYGFARLKFAGQSLLFALVVFTIVIPPQTIMIPTYIHYRFFDVFGLYGLFTGNRGINLLDSFWPFFISSATAMGMKNGLYIFIFRQFFRSLPKELEEATYVDGADIPKSFLRVILPNTIPALVTVLLFSIVWQWNDNYYVSLYMNNINVLSSMLGLLPGNIGRVTSDPSYVSLLVNTGTLLVIAPIFVLYLFAQKYFVESVERTGVVG